MGAGPEKMRIYSRRITAAQWHFGNCAPCLDLFRLIHEQQAVALMGAALTETTSMLKKKKWVAAMAAQIHNAGFGILFWL